MSGLARLAVARPRAALAGWLVAIVALGVLGTGVESRLTQSIFVLPGTETEDAIELAADTFGESVFVPVLLEGPPRAIERQGPRLVEAIDAQPGWRALSPWDSGPAARALRPRDDAAMVVASVSGPYEEIFDQTAERIRTLVEAEVEPPLEARITGMPVIGNSIKEETYSSARHAERVAIPILIVVLLLVFRAPIAALFPAVVGLTTVVAASGALWLLAGSVPIDPIAISLSSMMGLALGVDYSLLIVSRFREQIAAGQAPREAAVSSMATAGRTVLFAGGTLLAAMAVGIAISPGDILLSAVAGVATSTVLSVVSAFVAIPAALAMFGAHLDRWRIGARRDGGPAWLAAVRGALARPGLAAAAVVIPLLVLAAPAFGLNTGPPDVSQLPEDDRARLDYERVAEVMGPGWAAPFEVAIVNPDGPITAPDKLATLEGWQREIAASDHVAGVVGPGNIAPASRRAARTARALTRGTDGIGRLARGIGRARQGVRELERAQEAATAAIGELAQGSEIAGTGAEEISRRLDAVAGGSVLIRDAVTRLTAGGERLIEALAEGRRGTTRLVQGLDFAIDLVRFQAATAARLMGIDLGIQADEVAELIPRAESAEANLRSALAALDAMGIGRSDPQYQAAHDAVAAALEDVAGNPDPGETETGADIPPILSLARELELTETRLHNTTSDADRLERGMQRLAGRLREAKRGAVALRDGIEEVGGGTDRLRSGAVAIEDALGRLHDGVVAIGGGAGELREGLGELAGGAAQLAGGFRSGGERVGALVLGLDRAGEGAGRLHRRSVAIQRSLGGAAELFDSGYFVLAGIEAAPRERRAQAEVAVNVRSGGEAGRVLVVPTTGPNDEQTRELRDFLSLRTDELADQLGAEAAVGGTAAALAEYDERASGRLVWLIIALAAASYFVLIPVFRSFVLPALAVALNLISVGAAFGALALLFEGSDPVLGGPGYLDAVSVSAIYTVIFGLSLDYQVFLIHRMREGWLRFGETPAAISYGLERTAAVVTGAAAIMVAVFVAFALTDIAGTRQFGTGMVIAVILDATLVRLLLLPAAMRLAGDVCWWWPWGREEPRHEQAA